MKTIYLLLVALGLHEVYAQSCSTLNFQLKSEIPSTCNETTMTMLHDRLDRPFLYVANKEAGLKIYAISDMENPVLVKQISLTELASLDVMSLNQDGNYLYLALGNHFNEEQESGLAILTLMPQKMPL